MISATPSSSLSTSITIKVTSPDAQLSPEITKKELISIGRLVKLKNELSVATTRRNRFANGSSTRSRSLDNEKTKNRRRKLHKSQTLTSFSMKSRRSPMENGNGECKRGESAMLKLFNTTVDQSPLWTTLTHARTLTDFTAESWLHFSYIVYALLCLAMWGERFMYEYSFHWKSAWNTAINWKCENQSTLYIT